MPSEAMDIDVGQLVYPSLKDCPVVVDLHELSPVGRRATGGRDWRRLERPLTPSTPALSPTLSHPSPALHAR
jgi:hypothetical protein